MPSSERSVETASQSSSYNESFIFIAVITELSARIVSYDLRLINNKLSNKQPVAQAV